MRAQRTVLLIALALYILWMAANSAQGACIMSYCKEEAPKRSYITNNSRQIEGDLYWPGPTRRVQIRDNHRRIIGYIEADGSLTNINRQEIGEINE